MDDLGILQSPNERINIWRHLRSQMIGPNSSVNYSNLELGHAILVDSKPSFLR